jgi:hypothetical protein
MYRYCKNSNTVKPYFASRYLSSHILKEEITNENQTMFDVYKRKSDK